MTPFDLTRFLFEKRYSEADLARMVKQPINSIKIMCERGTIKFSFLRKLESIFGDCSEYIVKEEESQVA